MPEGFYFPIDTTLCNNFPTSRSIVVGNTINVFYGDCIDASYGGECMYLKNGMECLVEIIEGFEYVNPYVGNFDCFNEHIEDEHFMSGQNSCLYLKFDKTEPIGVGTVKIKFVWGPNEISISTFNVIKPQWHFASTDSFIVLEYGDYKSLNDYDVLTQCNTAWPYLPENAVITKEIVQGSEYGQLWNSYTNEYGNMFNDGDIYLVANGVKPVQDEEIIVRVSTNVAGVAPLDLTYIVRPVDIEVTVTPPTISAGDTAVITLQKKYTDGTIVNFDEGQTFNIAKIDGCMLGDLLVEGVTGPYFPYIYQPFRFVADSLADIGTVKIKIGVPKYPSFGSRPIRIDDITPKQTEEAVKNDKQKTQENLEPQPNGPTDNQELTCAPELITETLQVNANLVVGNEIIIKSPLTPFFGEITTEPKMPTIEIQATLNHIVKESDKPLKFEWEFEVSRTYLRYSLKGKPLCDRFSQSTFKGKSYSKFPYGYTKWTVPFDKDSGTFLFKSLRHNKNNHAPYSEGYDCNGQLNTWYEKDKPIFTGGDLKVSVIVKNNSGKIIAKLKNFNLGKIIGLNPDSLIVKAYTNDKAIYALLDAEGRKSQFKNGNPLYGKPNGFGLCQLDDPAATETQLWNWKENLGGGKLWFNTIKDESDKPLNNHPENVTEDMRLLNAYSWWNYKGWEKYHESVYYFKWDGKNWIPDDRVPKRKREKLDGTRERILIKYADWVYSFYQWHKNHN